MNRRILSFLYFFLIVSILIAALKVSNYIPIALQKDTIRKYKSLEDVKSNLNTREIFIPTYFPQNFIWPPSMILAQKKAISSNSNGI